jgi:hypothetical protein
MPNCFSLTKIGEEEPTNLLNVDTELWCHFEGKEPDGNTKWYRYWHETVGLELAMGRSFEEIKEALPENTKMLPLVEYLEKNYTVRAWYEHK